MDKEEFLDFCIKNNLPFEIEFEKPWYPKPIEIPASISVKELITKLEQALLDSVVYGSCIFLIKDK